MSAALAIARTQIGRTGENPSVGCILVKNGAVVARAATADGGAPHAEAAALEKAGEASAGATAYVTLEPCSHYGRTPPCAEALIKAGVKRVVIAALDPDPRVNGRGVAMLAAAGVDLSVGLFEAEARQASPGFFSSLLRGRPYITLKSAASADGRITDSSGRSKWITGEEARLRGHILRASHHAIAVGSATLTADNPHLDCRAPGLEAHTPDAIIFDTHLQTPLSAAIFASPVKRRVIIFHAFGVAPQKATLLKEKGAVLHAVPTSDKGLCLSAVLEILNRLEIRSLLIEGGGKLLASFYERNLFDEIACFRAPFMLSAAGAPSFAGFRSDLTTAEKLPIIGRETYDSGDLTIFRNPQTVF